MTSTLEIDILMKLWDFFVMARIELLLFAVAIIAYFALFNNSLPRGTKLDERKAKVSDEDRDRSPVISKAATINLEEYDNVEKGLRAAFQIGDHRTVLRCWNAMKKLDQAPSVSLAHVVESMQRFKKDNAFIIRELKAFFVKYPSMQDMCFVNDLVESLAKRLDSELMDKIIEMISSIDLKSDQRTYEIFLNMYFTTRSFEEVKTLVAEMKAHKVPFTTCSMIVIIKTALKTNNLEEARVYFRELKSVFGGATPSTAPRHIISQIVELACKEHQLAEFLPELQGVPITEEVLIVMLLECVRQKDICLTQTVEKLARDQKIKFSDSTFSLLIKGFSSDSSRVQELVDEAMTVGVEFTADFAMAILSFCASTANVTLADQLYEHMKPKQLPVLSAFIRFYADNEQFEKACDVYESDLQKLQNGQSAEVHRGLFLDARMERSLMNAALRCNRSSLAQKLLDSSPSDVAKHISMIRNCAAERNLQGAKAVFESLRRSGVDLNSVIYNTVLDACVECRDLKAAEAWMVQAQEEKMADVVSYNTLIKAYLHNDNFSKARSLMEDMKGLGIQPNRVTYNELVNALISKGGDNSKSQIWEIIDEMKTVSILPNQVTCSILLKSLSARSGQQDIVKTMDLIGAMEEPMDEVLLSSVMEACVRIGKPDLLVSKLKQLQGANAIAINGSHTFGSLIKAYGHAKDIDGVWRCWKDMRSRHVKPTSITLGCMVEAVVSNGDTEGAFDLIHQMQDDDQCRDSLNSVIYCSVLKGFTREKKMERVWAVYEEMCKRSVELSVVTYNTLIDACARCGRMEHVADITDGMQRNRIKPNVITYSTMLKGHCQNGDIQKGFAILEQMKKEARLCPDEIMYNSLLDGCAQNNMVDEGLRLLEEMQKEGVIPSNFTLSILVKLMNRARKLDAAFAIVEDITTKYKFRANVHVYTNLIQACISSRQLPRALTVLQQMVKERVQPENRTYGILIRASFQYNQLEQAAGLLRGGLGLPGALPFLQASGCPSLDNALVNETLVTLAERGCNEDLAAPLLLEIKQGKPRVRIDLATQRKVMSNGLAQVNARSDAPWADAGGKASGGKGSNWKGGW